MVAGFKCKKCHKDLKECPVCKNSRLTCRNCNNTRLVCLTHGGHHGN